MSVDFYFNPPTHSIPSRAGLKAQWSNVPNPDVLEAIATEAQYLDFHLFVLKRSKHTRVGCLISKPYEYQLGLSVRAGAIKAALLLCASIAEGVLRAHAEKRGYKLGACPRMHQSCHFERSEKSYCIENTSVLDFSLWSK